MHFKMLDIHTATTAILLILFSGMSAAAAEPKSAKEQREVSTVELMISRDGKAIVDQNGKEVARFVEDLRIQAPNKESTRKMPGCMRCWKECQVYEGERCVTWIRTCQWDFDCK